MNDADVQQEALIQELASHFIATGNPVELINTHISRVLLVNEHAYKFKRPIRLPFVDYSTLAARRYFCEEELRINRRLAPDVYLQVVEITHDGTSPQIEGAGNCLETAVCMRRFASDALWSEQIKAHSLREHHIDALGARLADFHAQVEVAPSDSAYGHPQERRQAALNAVRSLADHVSETDRALVETWILNSARDLTSLWTQRASAGRVRECHGDLHLRNLLVEGDTAMAFDAIEFNPMLRWIDVLDDIAFTVMDLEAYGRRDFAFRLLDVWLAASGDYAGLPGLRYASIYRALVRAEVAMLQNNAAELERYFQLACALSKRSEARLLITHGLPGSGKSVCALQLLQAAGAIRIRSDVERKRLAERAPEADSGARAHDLYERDMTDRTYAQLLQSAAFALEAGLAVILDAAYLQSDQRAAAARFAAECGVPFTILDCRAPLEVLRARVTQRLARGTDPSEADVNVLEKLSRLQEPLSEAEQGYTITIDTTVPCNSERIAERWAASS